MCSMIPGAGKPDRTGAGILCRMAAAVGGGGVGEDLFSAVHPGKTQDEIYGKMGDARDIVSSEVWELLDSVFPETE